MADENKPAFYPRVGNIRNKNFKSAQPMPFIDDERAMELPQYSEFIPKLGTVDLSVPTKENRELNRRITQRDADLMRQVQADRSFPEKLAGGLQAGRLMGSALAQSVASIPTAITKGGKAAEEYIAENMYKPTQPLAYEYAGDIGDFLEKLETQYKIPPVLPEAMALQYLTGPATAQAMRTAGKGAEQAGRAIERRMEPVVRGALEQGGLPREMVMAMGANTQSNVIKPKGGNWLRGDVEKALDPLLAQGMINNRNIPYGPEFDLAIRQRIEDLKQAASQPDYKGGAGRVAEHLEREMENPRTNEVALNKWIQSNLTNYVKKEMGTPEDPVRKLAEQGISHLPRDLQNIEMTWTPEELAKTRKRFGFPEEETATNPTAKMWEQMADEMIAPSRATEFGEKARQQNPWLEKLNPYDTVYETMRGMPQALKFDHIVDVLRQDVASGRIRPEQLNKVSMEQAVRRTYEYDQELAKKMNEARMTSRAELPVYKEYPEGLKWVELNRPGDFAAESDAMGHSVRGYEPPEGSSDWTKSSGDSGYSGYGLGGWNAIKRGDAKVYSLVDAKGEPHVTVEVGAFKGQLRNEDLLPYKEAALEEAKKLPNGYTDYDVRDIEIRMAKENMPAFINQIKGKQNAKPKEEYLPFVQDFVRGGNWSDVRDFNNTNLISADQIRKAGWDMKGNKQKYFTWQEFEDLKNAEQKRVEGGGMKAGGKVSISNNPDTMMLEVNNQKMKNGVPAYAGGKLIVGKGLKAAKPPKIEVPRLSMQFGNDLPINMNTAEVENLARRFPEPTVDRVNMAHKDVLKRTPELQEAAARIEAGDISADEYARLVQRYKPVTPYESVPAPASREEILAALSKTSREAEGLPRKETYFGKPSSTLKEGDPVGLRLDIPSYNQANTWVVTAHGPRKSPVSGGAGTRIGYEPVAMATDVDFSVSPKAALGIAKGAEKNTIATMEGKWKPTSSDEAFTLAKQYLKNPEWRQVGMDNGIYHHQKVLV